MRTRQKDDYNLRIALQNSKMLSSDVCAAFDPIYASSFEKNNSSYLSEGMVFEKFTGARGKSGSNDANAEYIAELRRIMDDNNVRFQTGELGKVDLGGGGTIAYIMALYGIDAEGGAVAAGYVQDSIASVLGSFGPIFIAVAMCFFAFTTLIGNYSYCEGCYEFIIGREAKKGELIVMRIIAALLVFVGSIASASLVWDIADMMQGLMVVTNVPTIIILGGIAFKCLDNYRKQKAQGLNPTFKSKDIDIRIPTDHWN